MPLLICTDFVDNDIVLRTLRLRYVSVVVRKKRFEIKAGRVVCVLLSCIYRGFLVFLNVVVVVIDVVFYRVILASRLTSLSLFRYTSFSGLIALRLAWSGTTSARSATTRRGAGQSAPSLTLPGQSSPYADAN